MTQSRASLFATYVVMLIVLLTLTAMVFSLSGSSFVLHLGLFLLYGLLAVIAMLGLGNTRGPWKLMMFLFLLGFIEMLYLMNIVDKLPEPFLPLLLTPVIGFFIAMMSIPESTNRAAAKVQVVDLHPKPMTKAQVKKASAKKASSKKAKAKKKKAKKKSSRKKR